jgi:hypothetical protein
MEADWSVEIGVDLPTIVVPWEDFIDLRCQPSLAHDLQETAASPGLAESLVRLNQETSPVFTSKCDLWTLSADEIDPLEFDAAREEAEQGVACYVDILARNEALFSDFRRHESWVRASTSVLRKIKLPQSRTELVIRPGLVNRCGGFAITLYIAACGRTADAAQNVFHTALEAAAAVTMKQAAIAGE